MSKPQSFKRIIIEDFDEKDRPLISKLAYSINVFAEDILDALNKNLTIEDNLAMAKKDLTVAVDADGRPTTAVTLNSGLKGLCVGIQVIKATNLTVPTTLTTGTPFINFIDNSGVITIKNITNLTVNNKYQLKLILHS